MSYRVDSVDAAPRVRPVAAGTRTATAGEATVTQPGADRVELSSTPPAEALEAVDRALARTSQLAAQNRELHFSKNEETGRIVIQVRDLEGRVIRTVPNTEAFAILDGAAAP